MFSAIHVHQDVHGQNISALCVCGALLREPPWPGPGPGCSQIHVVTDDLPAPPRGTQTVRGSAAVYACIQNQTGRTKVISKGISRRFVHLHNNSCEWHSFAELWEMTQLSI